MRAMQLVSQMLAQTSPSTHSSSFSALTPCPPSVTCTERAMHDAGAHTAVQLPRLPRCAAPAHHLLLGIAHPMMPLAALASTQQGA